MAAVKRRLFLVVEPVDEGVLVLDAVADELVPAVHGQGPVAPRAVGEQHRAQAPLLRQVGEVDVLAELGAGQVVDARFGQACVDAAVLLLALVVVPAGQTVFDLPVRAFVLLDHDDFNALIGEDLRGHGA